MKTVADGLRYEIEHWCKQIGVRPKRVAVMRMTRKWASCSTRGRVSFSRDLVRSPRRFREFVIVHELLHLQVPNHGRLFKSLLTAFLPDWEDRARAWGGPRPRTGGKAGRRPPAIETAALQRG